MQEGAGRYLDLHDMYNHYINSKFGERVEYSAYLDVFSSRENTSQTEVFKVNITLKFCYILKKPPYLFLVPVC